MKNNKKVILGSIFTLLAILAANTVSAEPADPDPAGKVTPTQDLIACTMDAKICADGSAVGRIAPNCEFAKCPEDNATLSEVKPAVEKGNFGPGTVETTSGGINTTGLRPTENTGEPKKVPAQQEQNVIMETATVRVREVGEDKVSGTTSIQITRTQQETAVQSGTTSASNSGSATGELAKEEFMITEGTVTVKTESRISVKNEAMFMQTSQGEEKEVKMTPTKISETAVGELNLKTYEIELKNREEVKGEVITEMPIYIVTGEREVKFFGLFKMNMTTESVVSAETGEVEETKTPWWSFLASK